MEIARLKDEDGDTHSVLETSIGSHVIRVGHSDDDMSEAYRIEARDALRLIDAAGANTTANELRANLEESRDCGQSGPCAIAPGCQRHWEERNRELVAELAAANETIAQLRQLDTVRPVVDLGQVWNDGYDSCKYNRDIGRVVEKNPYR